MKIYHHSNLINKNRIIDDGFIDLELVNLFRQEKEFYRGELPISEDDKINFIQSVKYQRKLCKIIGRYVWFTEEEFSHTSTSDGSFSIVFSHEDIPVRKWTDVMKSKMGNKKSRWIINHMNQTAEIGGDDWRKYWVSTKKVPLNKSLGYLEFNTSQEVLSLQKKVIDFLDKKKSENVVNL